MISIDGVDLPSPSRYKISRSDLDSEDSNRNELGELIRHRIRQGIYKIELEFICPSPGMHTIETAIEPPEINVTFPTPIGKITKKMYAGNREGPELTRHDIKTDEVWWKISFNLIEV